MFAWLKKHWVAITGFVGALFILFFSRRSGGSSETTIKKINEIREDELKKLDTINAQKQDAQRANDEKLVNDVKAVEEKHVKDLNDFVNRQKSDAEKLSKDPDALLNDLVKTTGFKVIEPKE